MFVSCSLNLSHNKPTIAPNTTQNTPIVNIEAILKPITKLVGTVTLSGFGGNTRYVTIMIAAYIDGTITIDTVLSGNTCLLFNFLYDIASAKVVKPEIAIIPTYKISL